MSYRTEFSLKVQDGPTTEDVARYLAEHQRLESLAGHRREDADTWDALLTGGLPLAWYNEEACLKAVSRHWPEAVFTLRGNGDDQGDLWVKYFKGGRMQVESAVHWSPAPFDPELLR